MFAHFLGYNICKVKLYQMFARFLGYDVFKVKLYQMFVSFFYDLNFM